MQPLTLLLLALNVEAAVLNRSALNKRQFFNPAGLAQSLNITANKTPSPPVLSETLKAESFPEALRKQVVWGPYTLQPAHAQHLKGEGGIKLDQHSDLFEYSLDGLCKDCLVLDMRLDVTDRTGKKLQLKDEVYTHHTILSLYGQQASSMPISATSFCPNGIGGLPDLSALGDLGNLIGSNSIPDFSALGDLGNFPGSGGFGAGFPGAALGNSTTLLTKGHEANRINFASLNKSAKKSGIWIGKDDKVMNSVEIVNYKETTQDVYFTIDMEYLDYSTKPTDYLNVVFGAMPAMDCSDIRMTPPSDRMTTYATPEYTVTTNSYLINFNPHLHDGALNMRLFLNDTLVCDSEAIYDESGGLDLNGAPWETINHYTPCDTIKLSPGDKVKMTSDYDVRQHRLRPDSANHEMGADIMAIAFVQFAIEG